MGKFIAEQPKNEDDWNAIIESIRVLYQEHKKKIKPKDFAPEYTDIDYLVKLLDKVTSFSLWASAMMDEWLEIEVEVKEAAGRTKAAFESSLNAARNDETRVNRLVTSGRSWAERESSYLLTSGTLHRANEVALLAVEMLKIISLSMRQTEKYLRNLREDISLRVRMMQLQATLSHSPIYD